MNTLDLVLAGILLVSGLIGLLRGLIRETLSLLSWVVALWLAVRFGGDVAGLFSNWFEDATLQLWAGRLAVLVGALFAGTLLAWLISYLVRHSPLTGMDRFLGLFFGCARGVVLVGILALGLEQAGFASEPWWRDSKLLPYAAAVGVELRNVAEAQLSGQQGA